LLSRHAITYAIATLLAACAAPSRDAGIADSLPVIPAPAKAQRAAGEFTLDASVPLVVGDDPQLARIADYFADLVARTTKLKLQRASASAALPARHITFELVQTFAAAPEAYALEVTPDGVRISAGTHQGLFYGAITLWQLVTPDGRVPAVRIEDAPRFAWRGFMLDSARHFMPPEFVKRLLDAMAIHKLNTFHWHLTDDQGWRLEIRKYPQLTGIGAWRTPAGAAGAAGKYGAYYTQDEVRDIVRYAAERFITVVPEIDMPGHAQAAIAAYPELGTEGPRPPVSPDWGIHTYLYNVEDSTFAFLTDVLGEVIELFPGPYIHVGGDEAVKDRWIASPRVQQRMRELGVADETALQSYFIGRIERHVRERGRRIIGWDEILEGGLPQSAAVMSWRGVEGAATAAKHGHDAVLSPAPLLYLDYLQSDAATEPPGRPTYVTLADVYAFEPVPEGIGPEEARHILGAQVNAWTEHMRTPERIEHNTFPRAAALAEVTWSPRAARDWDGFLARLAPQLRRYEALGIRYAGSAFEPRFEVETRGSAAHVRLSNQVKRGELRYTLDGSEPTAASSPYREPLVVEMPARLRAATFVEGRRMGASRARVLDRESLRLRTDDELRTCTRSLVLRLEDDAPVDGSRAVFNVDIMDPCWVYEDADLTGIRALTVTVGQLPFNFQIGRDVEKIPLRAPQTQAGELEVRLDACDGERIAVLPLAPAVSNPALTTLPHAALPARSGRHDLCFLFTRRAIEPMWVVDSVQLLE
jgi:hexosaminidase